MGDRMSTKQTDFVFWNLKEAIVDSVVNIHRLSQLTGPGVGRLGEEKLTDLLAAWIEHGRFGLPSLGVCG